jgi:ArsR family transcriptional regulator
MSNLRNDEVEHLAAMFKALSNPQRLRMFIRLATTCCVGGDSTHAGEKVSFCCAGDLGADLDLAASTVSHHLKELRQAGLMQVERQGQKISCWVHAETLRRLASFFEANLSRCCADGAELVSNQELTQGGPKR